MPDRHTTVIIFLIDNRGVPGFNDENYLCSLFEAPQTSSFSPAKVTHDNKGLRKKIITLIDDGIESLDELRDGVGRRIWVNLGMGKVFRHLTKYKDEVTFLTNDPAIPWEWATAYRGRRSICELVSCGTVFFEQMELAANAIKSSRSRGVLQDVDKQIAKMKAVLLFDTGDHNGLKPLPGVDQEVVLIRDVLVQAGLKDRNVKIIDGGEQDAEDTFVTSLRDMRRDLGIIHYAGHVLNGNLQLKHNKIQPQEIKDIFEGLGPKNKLLRTLVFINGCESGEIAAVWDKGKNMSTAWLEAGAGGIICCRLPVADTEAREFAVSFYQNLLSPEGRYGSVGIALRTTRLNLAENQGPNVDWLQYTLFGYPFFSVFNHPSLDELAPRTAVTYDKVLKEMGNHGSQ